MKDKCFKCNRQLYLDETIRIDKNKRTFHIGCRTDEPVKQLNKFLQKLTNIKQKDHEHEQLSR